MVQLESIDRMTAAATFGLIVWSLAERLIHTLGLRQPTTRNREWSSSIAIVAAFVVTASLSLLDNVALAWTHLPTQWRALRYAGFAMLAAGFVVRIVARAQLGRHFSVFVQTTPSHTLITTGLYAYIRHPAYLGTVLIFCGYPLALGSAGGFLCALGLGVPAIVYRIRVEERALYTWFGEDYVAYQARTARLFPRLW